MKKNLIVYFSHRGENYINGKIQDLQIGNTEIIAKKIDEKIEADIFEIIPLHEYPRHYHKCTDVAKKEHDKNERPKIINIVSHMEQYDTIYLGYPNWWGTMPMCVWTFLENYDLSNKDIYPFCTHEGSGIATSIEDLKKLCPSSNIKKGFDIYGSQVEEDNQKLQVWMEENEYDNK